jgi:hypothetical protein
MELRSPLNPTATEKEGLTEVHLGVACPRADATGDAQKRKTRAELRFRAAHENVRVAR